MVYTDLFLQPPSKRIDPAGNTDDFTYYHVDRMPLAGRVFVRGSGCRRSFPAV